MNGETIDIQLQIAPRARSLRLVCSIAGMRLCVPRNHSIAQVESFVASRRIWITRTHAYYEKLLKKCGGYEPNTIFYLGTKYNLRVIKDRQTFASVSESMRLITFHVPNMKSHLETIKKWYKAETEKIVTERLPIMAMKMDLKYNRVTVKDITSRWASCSIRQNLSFSLLLAAAPPEVIDYVIAHELAHLVRMDHSSHFWKVVSDVDHNFERHRAWLSDYAPLLRLEQNGNNRY